MATRELLFNLYYSADGSVASGHPIEIQRGQITVNTLSRMFNLNPNTIWLQQRHGRKVYFPNQNSEFDLSSDADLDDFDHFLVRGNRMIQPTSEAASALVRSPHVIDSIPGPSAHSGTPIRPIFSNKKPPGVCIKIIQAAMKRLPSGKVDFTQKSQTFIDLNEETAHVVYVTTAVQSKWGQDHVLVTGDGLPIEDCSGTKGLKFWKVGSRKIYAVKQSSTVLYEEVSSDDDTEAPFKRSKISQASIFKELKEIKRGVCKLAQMVPVSVLGFRDQIKDTFMCTVCREVPAKPPVVFSTCCNRILGCKSCIESTFSDTTERRCPICRAEQLREYPIVRGMDDFLRYAASVMEDGDNSVDN